MGKAQEISEVHNSEDLAKEETAEETPLSKNDLSSEISIDWAKIPAHVKEIYISKETNFIYYSKSSFKNESEYTTHVRK